MRHSRFIFSLCLLGIVTAGGLHAQGVEVARAFSSDVGGTLFGMGTLVLLMRRRRAA